MTMRRRWEELAAGQMAAEVAGGWLQRLLRSRSATHSCIGGTPHSCMSA
jgi:hypothetical protein